MQKLSARERRHKALVSKIERLTRRRNEGIKAIVTAEVQLPKLERQLRRFDLPVKPKKKPKPVEHPKVAAKETAVADALVEDREAHMKSLGFRPRRKRKTVADEVAKILGETLS